MTTRQIATITAALRLWQNRNDRSLTPEAEARQRLLLVELQRIADGGAQFAALDTEEIDQLCEEIKSLAS